MNLIFDNDISEAYVSASQKARSLTEFWMQSNMYCPVCGNDSIEKFENNRPVADFFCAHCLSEFELKSKNCRKDNFSSKVVNGSYNKLIERISSNINPNFFFLSHDSLQINNLVLIPNHFFIPSIIERRKPLSDNAKRSGWIGSNILIGNIPSSGKIYIVRSGKIESRERVIAAYARSKSLITDNIDKRVWLMDVLRCIEKIESEEFSLGRVYEFADELQAKHPNNKFIKAKIRQQLQILRDRDFIVFSSRGKYRKLLL